jgi:UDP-N-acetylmuramoyl-L-alanyl-D-glutamate--2,6-diaminopimelate ligase
MKFSELTRLEKAGVRNFFGPADAGFSDACYDSRQVTPGSLFFAIRGYAVDGHSYIRSAVQNGAMGIVLEDEGAFSEAEAERDNVLRIVVTDSRLALALVSDHLFGYPSTQLRLIGVTGTNGKTTVTHIIKQLLEARGERVGLIGTIGITAGDEQLPASHTTPESREISEILRKMVDRNVSTCVMEVSSHALALSRVAALDFDIAAFTNLTQDHLDFHSSMAEYLAAKQLLFTNLKDTAVAVTNIDSAVGLEVTAQSDANVHTYGILKQGVPPQADLFAESVELSIDSTRFIIRKRYSDESAVVETKLIGSFNVENILAAISALYFGVEGCSLESLARDMKFVEPVRGRFESVALPNGATAIIDYAHTPDALEHVLSTARELRPGNQGRIVTVFGCGGDRDASKRPIMGNIAAKLSDCLIVTNDNPRSELPHSIANQIMAGIPLDRVATTSIVLDRKVAIEVALDSLASHDVLIIAGKGHEDYQIIGNEKLHFDDREEVILWARTHV